MKLAKAFVSILTFTLPLFAQLLEQPISPNINVDVSLVGTTSIPVVAAGSAAVSQPQIKPLPDLKKPVLPGPSVATGVNTSTLAVPGLPIAGSSVLSFNGLDVLDEAMVSGGIVEPPDEAIGVSTSQVLEGVNVALAVHSQTGAVIAGPISYAAFFHVPAATATFEERLSDPRILFDTLTNRWFLTILQFPVNPKAGTFLPGSQILLAASKTSDARGPYNLFKIDVSENSFPGCPCLGDQPLLGVNADGVFLNVNEFRSATLTFDTNLLLALDKAAIEAGSSTVHRVGFIDAHQAEGPAFSISPGLLAPGTPASENSNIEYFLSSLDFTGTVDNRLTIWELSGTASLSSSSPSLSLKHHTFTTEAYGQPPSAKQKTGPFPLGMSLGQPEERLDCGDDRMQQAYFTNGTLVAGVNTVILSTSGAAPRCGIAWFQIQPSTSGGTLSASVAKQGYVAAQGTTSIMYPAVALSRGGLGAIALSFSGPNNFPSAGFVLFDNANVGGAIHVAGAGVAPEDGFTGYPPFGDGVARWGDYSSAVVSPGGRIWSAAEYIPDRTRLKFANWGSRIYRPR
jgi:hypothetical protein